MGPLKRRKFRFIICRRNTEKILLFRVKMDTRSSESLPCECLIKELFYFFFFFQNSDNAQKNTCDEVVKIMLSFKCFLGKFLKNNQNSFFSKHLCMTTLWPNKVSLVDHYLQPSKFGFSLSYNSQFHRILLFATFKNWIRKNMPAFLFVCDEVSFFDLQIQH